MTIEARRDTESALRSADEELRRAARDHADAEAAARAAHGIGDRVERQVAIRDADARVGAAAATLVTMRRARNELLRRLTTERLAIALIAYQDSSRLLTTMNAAIVRSAVTFLNAVWARERLAEREHREAIQVRAAVELGLNEEARELMSSQGPERIPTAIDEEGDVTEWAERPVKVLGDMEIAAFAKVVANVASVPRSVISRDWVPGVLLDAVEEIRR